VWHVFVVVDLSVVMCAIWCHLSNVVACLCSLFCFPFCFVFCFVSIFPPSSPGSCEWSPSCGRPIRTGFVFLSLFVSFSISFSLTYSLWSAEAVCGHIVEVGCGGREAS